MDLGVYITEIKRADESKTTISNNLSKWIGSSLDWCIEYDDGYAYVADLNWMSDTEKDIYDGYYTIIDGVTEIHLCHTAIDGEKESSVSRYNDLSEAEADQIIMNWINSNSSSEEEEEISEEFTNEELDQLYDLQDQMSR